MKKSNHIISMTCLVFGLMLISLGLFVYCRNMNVMTLVVAIIPILIGITLIRIGIDIMVAVRRRDIVDRDWIKARFFYRFSNAIMSLNTENNLFLLRPRDWFLLLIAFIIATIIVGLAFIAIIVFGK